MQETLGVEDKNCLTLLRASYVGYVQRRISATLFVRVFVAVRHGRTTKPTYDRLTKNEGERCIPPEAARVTADSIQKGKKKKRRAGHPGVPPYVRMYASRFSWPMDRFLFLSRDLAEALNEKLVFFCSCLRGRGGMGRVRNSKTPTILKLSQSTAVVD